MLLFSLSLLKYNFMSSICLHLYCVFIFTSHASVHSTECDWEFSVISSNKAKFQETCTAKLDQILNSVPETISFVLEETVERVCRYFGMESNKKYLALLSPSLLSWMFCRICVRDNDGTLKWNSVLCWNSIEFTIYMRE